MSRRKMALLPIVFCFFCVPCQVDAGPLGDELKKEKKDTKKINAPMRLFSAAGFFASSIGVFVSVKESRNLGSFVSGFGLLVSAVGLFGACDSLVSFDDDKEKMLQEKISDDQDGLKVVGEKKKKKKLREIIKKFFSRKKGAKQKVA